MLHYVHMPCPPLNRFVESLRYYEEERPVHAVDWIMPSAEIGVILNLRDDRFSVGGESFRGAVVGGAATKPFLLDTAQQTPTMGIVFRPGGAFSFLGPAVSDMRDCTVGLNDLWGLDAIELRERLVVAQTVSTKFSVLEGFLLGRLVRVPESHPAVKYALEQFGVPWPRAISEVTHCISLSKARFARLFQEQTGLTPKLFCRLQRFQRSVRLLHSSVMGIDLPDVALDLGYYDQPHFNHEFHAFSGITPTAYLQARGQHANHVPLRNTA